MERTALLVLVLVTLSAGVSAAAVGPSSPTVAPAPRLTASAVSFALNYSDPASDVYELWTSNNSHVTDAVGNWLMATTPGRVNLERVSSKDAGADVDVYLKVQTTIATLPNTSYEYRLYTRADNATHYIVTYRNGFTELVSNHTGSSVQNLTAYTTVGGQSSVGWLSVVVSKADLGGAANITKWDMDAQAKMVGAPSSPYTFVDYVWALPGNPGTAPAYIQGRVTDAGSGAGLKDVNVSTGSAGFFTTTDATGNYSLPAAAGTFTLTFTLAGYDPASRSVTVDNQQTQTVNVALTKTPSFPWLWIVVAILIVAAVASAFVALRRRKPSAK